MPRPLSAQQLADRFARRARRLELLGEEASRLYRLGRVSLGNVDSIYESAMLNSITSFELFLEDLFYSILLGHGGIGGSAGAVQFQSRAQAEEVILSGKQYLDWLPFKVHAMPRGKRLLTDSPFSRLDRHPELATLEEMRIVRNAIAHESGAARASFAPLARHLRARRRTPAGLLQEVRQGVTRHVEYTIELRALALALTAPTTRDAKILLRPEPPFEEGGSPDRGDYECLTCRTSTAISARRKSLPRCSSCAALRGPRGKSKYRRVY